MASISSIAVVYLARKAEGVEPVKKFIESYLTHNAGEPHDLVIVFKGYDLDDKGFAAVLDVLSAIDSYRSFHIDDSGIDISAYLRAAEKLEHRSLCFLNTFSEIAEAGWLTKLASNLRRPGVGLVGATGSYESLQSSFRFLMKTSYLCGTVNIPYDENLARHFGFWIKHHAPGWLKQSAASGSSTPITTISDVIDDHADYEAQYNHHWEAVLAGAEWLKDIPQFPNPHIRSNSFMIERERLVRFGFPKVVSKENGCRFESGPNSLTARVRRLGLAVLVVGKSGAGYDVADWPLSRTFRIGGQDNILVIDNQVRAFNEYAPETQAVHVFMTWGSYVEQDAAKLPRLGMKFSRATNTL